ncbi:histidine kinase [Fulvivirgaceae bacterium BMA10]|uniref:Histidine kinase n=1 Tax=Splendidivirga corallicola TaxID=3051826 RepID=A0ABT8KW74_9BACT|nr:histidine kinase [Fulvivirgaceae bacterium BMA10]
MKKVFINHIFFRLISPPIYGVLAYLMVLMANDSISQLEENFFTQEVWICIGVTYLLFEGMRITILLLDRFLPAQQNLTSRIVVQLLINVVLSIVISTAVFSIYFAYVIGYSSFQTELIILASIFIVSSILYNLLYIGFLYLNIQNSAIFEKENVERKTLEYRLRTFNNEINPDLLYGSLETLISLLYRSAEDSETFIDHLSHIYRYVLDNRRNEFVDLKLELDAAKHLLYVLNEKHDGLIQFEFEIDAEDHQRQIMTGALISLIEYIVNSSIIAKNQPLKIICYLEWDEEYLVLEKTLNDRLLIDGNIKDRFDNVQEAYAFFTDKPVMEVKAYNESFIKVPLLSFKEEEVLID